MPAAAFGLTAPQAQIPRQPRSGQYQPRRPENTLLHRVVRNHLASFLEQAAQASEPGVPHFVDKELRAYERLVPFSCKGRGLCPSCGGKRMTDLALHLTEHVIPYVPVRRFVLSIPHRLRYLLAYDHARCLAVLRIVVRAIFGFYRRQAPHGTAADRRTGALTFLQRFGSAANLNLHFHILVLDGVFAEADDKTLRFHAAPPPTDHAIAQLVVSIRRRVLRHVARCASAHEESGSAGRLGDESPLLAACYSTSIGRRGTLGARAGTPLARVGADTSAPRLERRGRLQAHVDGFDLHASLRVAAQAPQGRAPLENLVKYCARPPIAHDRLSELSDGRIAVRLKTPWSDGTTHVVYEPVDFIAKLAALIPRPRKNLVLYHGVLAAHCAWRERVVRYGRRASSEAATSARPQVPGDPATMRPRRAQWAELMRHAFGYALLTCPRCGCKMKLLACILDRTSIRKILTACGLPPEPPPLARASPQSNVDWDE